MVHSSVALITQHGEIVNVLDNT